MSDIFNGSDFTFKSRFVFVSIVPDSANLEPLRYAPVFLIFILLSLKSRYDEILSSTTLAEGYLMVPF